MFIGHLLKGCDAEQSGEYNMSLCVLCACACVCAYVCVCACVCVHVLLLYCYCKQLSTIKLTTALVFMMQHVMKYFPGIVIMLGINEQ